ncbi:MAG: LytTR family DNA-binding domain-containing protein [Pseudobacter sp.]|uniref:LytTR family DNA-binding domain-containing protein n=1 Tax=Pseudobacter sp. TaxID=2045420 RepID=UPI003F7F504E
MNRTNYIRVSFTLLLGIMIPFLSGLIIPGNFTPEGLTITCIFFIALTFLINTIARIFHLYLREQPWLNTELFKKVSVICAVNTLLSVFLSGMLVFLWITLTGYRTSMAPVLQFLGNMVLATLILTLAEELILLNRDKKTLAPTPQQIVVDTMPPVEAMPQQDDGHLLSQNIHLGIETAVHRRRSRLLLRKGLENIPVKMEDIALFYTENKIVYALDRLGKKYIADKKLGELETELNTDMFFRANRQYIIGLNFIKGFKPFEKVKLQVDLTVSEAQHLVIISQETAPAFRKWMSEA